VSTSACSNTLRDYSPTNKIQIIQGTSRVDGAAALNLFSKSGLQQEDLGLIWDLADMDGDGELNIKEFCIAMHMVSVIRKNNGGIGVPQELPAELRNLSIPSYLSPMSPIKSGLNRGGGGNGSNGGVNNGGVGANSMGNGNMANGSSSAVVPSNNNSGNNNSQTADASMAGGPSSASRGIRSAQRHQEADLQQAKIAANSIVEVLEKGEAFAGEEGVMLIN
jgi:hypothetical protein